MYSVSSLVFPTFPPNLAWCEPLAHRRGGKSPTCTAFSDFDSCLLGPQKAAALVGTPRHPWSMIPEEPLKNFLLPLGLGKGLRKPAPWRCRPPHSRETDVQSPGRPDRQTDRLENTKVLEPGTREKGKCTRARSHHTHIHSLSHGSLTRKVSCRRKSLLGHRFLSGPRE